MNELGTRELLRRRAFLKRAAGLLVVGAGSTRDWSAELDPESAELPFENGRRPLVQYPQKRKLLRLTTRPPQLETPSSVFNEGVMTPNDAFFVRYHLSNSPPSESLLAPDTFKLSVAGKVGMPLEFSVAELRSRFEAVEVTAVNQCSGNGRGFFNPRVPGGQSGNGMVGNARWKGVRLSDLLNKAGIQAGARQVTFDGLDAALVAQTPDFVKALDVDHALDGEVMVAYEMNGEELPWLNGFPLRLVVPGYYGTYWIKHLHRIQVIDEVFKGYWMSTAYRIPDNGCACVPPGTKPNKTIPIARCNVRSFITSLSSGDKIPAGRAMGVRGLAFDGGEGIREVLFSDDDGRNWKAAELGVDHGKYSFREWKIVFATDTPGKRQLMVRAMNRVGQTQPFEPLWNPAGYMRNVIEKVEVHVEPK